MNRRVVAFLLACSAMLLAVGHAAAQEPARAPAGDFALTASTAAGDVLGVLRVAPRGDGWNARLVPSGQPEVVLDSAVWLAPRLTLRTSSGEPIVLELRFEGDSALSGTFVAGEATGTLRGRRRSSVLHVGRPPGSDPDSARLIDSDVRLFWGILDRSTPESLVELLQREYLEGGTHAVRDFIPSRIMSAERLAQQVTERRERYEASRAASLTLHEVEPEIRRVFHELKRILPEAVFPDIYFVVGRLNTGGTTSPRGLLIGAEMYRSHEPISQIVAHELVHYQQRSIPPERWTLLAQSIFEGTADFVAELISGDHINAAAHEYGLAHEAELWQEFQEVMHGDQTAGWLYGNASEGRPADLGYFFGYRIAEAYYRQAEDKQQALRDILQVSDYTGLLERSRYHPGGP